MYYMTVRATNINFNYSLGIETYKLELQTNRYGPDII